MKGKLAEYVVRNNPQGASMLLTRTYGMKPTRSMAEMVQQMNYIIMKHRADALRNISEIHPDKELINNMSESVEMIAIPSINTEPVSNCDGCDKLTEKKSACSGCGGTCGGSSNAAGCGCGGSSNASGGKVFSGGGMWNPNQPENWVRYGSSNANGEPNTSTTTETKPMPPKEDGTGKAITYLAVGVVATIVAGIIFKSY